MSPSSIEVRLSLEENNLPVLRATMGAVAGTSSFAYDQILHLQVAVAEVFDMALRQGGAMATEAEVHTVAFRFNVAPGRIEVLATYPAGPGPSGQEELETESRAVLAGLIDEITFESPTDDTRIVRMVKYGAGSRPGQ